MEQFTVSFGLMILPDRISIRGYVQTNVLI